MINFVDLSLDLYPLKNQVTVTKIPEYHEADISMDEINEEFINLLNSIGIKICHSQFFYSPPYYNGPIHVDNVGGDYTKINYVFGGSNSRMFWYKLKSNIKVPMKKTMVGVFYKEYTTDQVDMIDSHILGFPSLVQVGIPHNMVNQDEPRICAAFVLHDPEKNLLTMSESVTRLQNYITM